MDRFDMTACLLGHKNLMGTKSCNDAKLCMQVKCGVTDWLLSASICGYVHKS